MNAIRWLNRRKTFERWETKIANTDVTPQAIWPIAKSLMKRDGAKKPTAIHGPFNLTFHSLQKANAIADCLENQFTLHDLCDENHKRQVEDRVQNLLEAVDNNSSKKIRPCDLQKLVNSLKLTKACRIDGNPNECLKQFPRRPLVHLTHPHLINLPLALSFSDALEGLKNYNLTKTRKGF
jgi:hypothetical protein